MPSKFSMDVLLNKIARCKKLADEEIAFAERRYGTLKRSYQAALARCDEAQLRAIVLSEAECEVEARRMERDYRLALRLDALIDNSGKGKRLISESGRKGAPSEPGVAFKICLSCYYEAQLENMLALQDAPISPEFLSALSELEAALLHLNDVAKSERNRAVWAN